MWDGPFYRVRRDGYEICFVPGAGEDLGEVCNVDMWVIRNDGDRWSGTVFTLDEVQRIMARQRQAGEPDGDYWWCWEGLVAAGSMRQSFAMLDPKRTPDLVLCG
jgi:hypothetical protein